jgi:hypothetical protein
MDDGMKVDYQWAAENANTYFPIQLRQFEAFEDDGGPAYTEAANPITPDQTRRQ